MNYPFLNRSILLFLLFFNPGRSFGQDYEKIYQDFRRIPQPPSPNASALGKFGDVPVSLNTGIPSISIPFYSYKDESKGLSLNVSINYHAGGHKVEDMASSTGLGWSLSAGGAISRTMKGRPDEDIAGYLNTPPLPMLNTVNYTPPTTGDPGLPISQGVCYENEPTLYMRMKLIAEGAEDGEADLFSINAGNISGKFFFKKDGQIELISQSNIKVEVISGGFLVTDPYGVKYYFTTAESIYSTPAQGGTPVSIHSSYISSYYLTKIVSADGKDEIVFTYEANTPQPYESGFSESRITRYNLGSGFTEYLPATGSFNYVTVSPKRVTSIALPDNTQISFAYNFGRLDYKDDQALTEIKVKNESVEKKFNLTYGYFESDLCPGYSSGCYPGLSFSANDYYKRLKLLSVQEVSGSKTLPPYTFEYNPNKLPTRNSIYQDWWGHYNGVGFGGVAQLPNSSPPYIDHVYLFGADRPASLEHTKAWVLDKIFYPTGGNTRFYYELNDGYNATDYREVGGLRVAKTIDFEPSTGANYTTKYLYKKDNNQSSGIIKTLPVQTAYWTTFLNNANGIVPHFCLDMNETKLPNQTLTFSNGSPAMYTKVKTFKENNSETLGYSTYEYSVDAGLYAHDLIYPFVQKQDFEWQNGLLLKENHYNNASEILKSTENQYDFKEPGILYDTATNSRNLLVALRHTDAQSTVPEYVWSAREYQLRRGRAELKKTIERNYSSPTTYSESVTDYTYDSQYFVPTKIETKNSKTDILEKRLYYAFNYNSTGLPQRNQLLTENRVAELVSSEEWIKQGSSYFAANIAANEYTTVSGMLKNNKKFQMERNDKIALGTIGNFNASLLLRNSGIKEQVAYTNYDTRGRSTEVHLQGNHQVAMFWGRSNIYPVCQVTNTGSADFAYTSFETDGSKGWTGIISGNIVSSKGLTGVKYYSQNNFALAVSGLNSSKRYVVSYWSKNGAYTVSGNQSGWPQQGKVATSGGQSWTYYQHVVTGVSSVSVTASGAGSIDELRLYPESSMMSSVAYNPLTGLTEEADAQGNVKFYQYDDFFRLSRILDYKGDILKVICYNYYNQAEDCTPNSTLPRWVPTGYTYCGPCPANPSYLSQILYRTEKDMNPASPTYNQSRSVSTGYSSSCENIAAWVSSNYCETDNGNYTGNQVLRVQDINPCSPTYNQYKITGIVSNQITCPPPGCEECASTGPEKKCINGNCETGMKIYTASVYNPNTGMYDCTYHYEWSDNSWSPNYSEQNFGECPVF